MKYFIILMKISLTTYVNTHDYNWQNHINTEFQDITSECIDGDNITFYIPEGTGVASAQVIMITNLFVAENNPLNCVLDFRISKRTARQVQIMVIEYFVNLYKFENIMKECWSANKWEYLQLTESIPGSQAIHICDEFKRSKRVTPLFTHVSEAEYVFLRINPEGNTSPMKITVSAARKIDRHDTCLPMHEIPCIIEKELICLETNLACDGNINCGVFDDQDEDYRVCLVQETSGYWFAVLVGIILLIGVYVVFIYLIKSYIPKISDNFFIFNEDKENKLMLKSQLNSHIWRKPRKMDEEEVFCVCQETSDTSISIFSD